MAVANPLDPPDRLRGHRNNLRQKIGRARGTQQVQLAQEAEESYQAYLGEADAAYLKGGDWVPGAVAALDTYLTVAKRLEKADSLFNWRSDFAGSVIPEFLIRYSRALLTRDGLVPIYSTRDSVVELTLTGAGSGWTVRRKDQDFCLGLEELELETGTRRDSFLLPLVVAEIKTNLDINKLSGLNYSAEGLKRSFPMARYFVVTETVDFSRNDNYVSGYVDEIYVLRRVMRSKHRRGAVPLQADVFAVVFDDVRRIVAAAGAPRGHVYARLPSGKLIHG